MHLDARKAVQDKGNFSLMWADAPQSGPFRVQLVLQTGAPEGEYKAPVFVDWDALHRRGEALPISRG